ncbi:MAG: hypothetical protein QHH00_07785 [Methanomassiliicoccales archaeon]|jgi:hypothetical protein|nr:hypothetical protein [Methanomassiliicoccales archaeon]
MAEGYIGSGGQKLIIEESGVCNVCKSELKKLEEIYKKDFEKRTSQVMLRTIPWPAFKEFSWPPHSAVLVSGWELRSKEFAVGITDSAIIGGRRSIASLEEEIAAQIKVLAEAIERAESIEERLLLRKEYDLTRKKLDPLEKKIRVGDRPLFILPLYTVRNFHFDQKDSWLFVGFEKIDIKSGLLRLNREKVERHRWVVSAIYRDAIVLLDKMIDMNGEAQHR